jgi:predicted acylesterase/phospholipase RssA
VIWSALLASTAVPGILPPVCLMQKLKSGQVVPWSWGSKFKDGSLRVDIPLQALNLYFNGTCPPACLRPTFLLIGCTVTHPVVSQVNPHVHLFFFAPRGSAGKPVASRKGTGTFTYMCFFSSSDVRRQVGVGTSCCLLANSGSRYVSPQMSRIKVIYT